MTPRLAAIWRHPIKSHGAEALERVVLSAGQALPFDRAWAVVRGGGANPVDGTVWAPCGNFSRGAITPALMAIRARFDADTGRLRLSHPDCPDLDFCPDTEAAAFLGWVTPLMAPGQPAPQALVRARAQAMTDTDYPSVSVLNLASLNALEQAAGHAMSPRRFRGNLWLEGLAPWAEEGTIGQELRIGNTVLRLREPIQRCRATEANPDTGARDIGTLDLLRDLRGTVDFGVYAEVLTGGEITPGDVVEIA